MLFFSSDGLTPPTRLDLVAEGFLWLTDVCIYFYICIWLKFSSYIIGLNLTKVFSNMPFEYTDHFGGSSDISSVAKIVE